MTTSEPASLQNLNDIVMPGAISWWPLATGWYVLATLLLVLLIWVAYRMIRHRKANRYRRVALHELQLLTAGIENPSERDASLRQIPALLKRAALSVYSRRQVASLSGRKWHEFLNMTTDTEIFTADRFELLEKIAYSTDELSSINADMANDLVEATNQWIRRHRAIGQ